MAGRPRTRAKQAAAAAAPTAPAIAEPLPDAQPAPNAPARARARDGARPLRAPYTGPGIRNAADSAQADALRSLAQHIRPGHTLRIERAAPRWCSGWLEDWPLDDPSGMGELLEYLRDEHGGQVYAVTVIGTGDVPLYTGRLTVAGPPKQRGRRIDRDEWEGNTRAPNPEPTPRSGGGSLEGLGDFLRLFIEQQRATSDAQLAAVRDTVARGQEQTTALVNAVLQRDASREQSQSLSEQLAQFAETSKGLQKVGKQLFGAAAPRERNAGDDDDPLLTGALKEASKHFLSTAISGAFVRPKAPQPPPRTVRNHTRSIEDAIPTPGKPRPKS